MDNEKKNRLITILFYSSLMLGSFVGFATVFMTSSEVEYGYDINPTYSFFLDCLLGLAIFSLVFSITMGIVYFTNKSKNRKKMIVKDEVNSNDHK